MNFRDIYENMKDIKNSILSHTSTNDDRKVLLRGLSILGRDDFDELDSNNSKSRSNSILYNSNTINSGSEYKRNLVNSLNLSFTNISLISDESFNDFNFDSMTLNSGYSDDIFDDISLNSEIEFEEDSNFEKNCLKIDISIIENIKKVKSDKCGDGFEILNYGGNNSFIEEASIEEEAFDSFTNSRKRETNDIEIFVHRIPYQEKSLKNERVDRSLKINDKLDTSNKKCSRAKDSTKSLG